MMKMLHATVSHDMMNPISAITMFADELVSSVKEGDNTSVEKYHKIICDSSKLVSCRMKDLLDMNLIERNSFVPREVKFRPLEAINQIKSILECSVQKIKVNVIEEHEQEVNQILLGDVERI